MTFRDLGIIEPILKALDAEGYTNPTPIQEKSIPILLEGNDLLGCAQTGTGKTAAFGIPILQHIYQNRGANRGPRKIKALIVTPTRELAIQIGESLTAYSKFTDIRNTVIFGGVKQNAQTNALRKGVDVLIATPGRLLDLIQQGFISLRDIEHFILDEADQMLDMGFIHDIRKLLTKLPAKRQSLFFSATMPKNIVDLSSKILTRHKSVSVKPEQATADKVEQALYYVNKKNKIALLVNILEEEKYNSVLVFTRTKHGANKVVKLLDEARIKAEAIHGNKSQAARQRALSNFKEGSTKVLVATDIAARGIDVAKLALVVNFELPNLPETYVHRIGRTGRAKASGIAISFCDTDEKYYLRDIQKLISQEIPLVREHVFMDESIEKAAIVKPKKQQQQRPPRKDRKKPSGDSKSTRRYANKKGGDSKSKPKSKSTRRYAK